LETFFPTETPKRGAGNPRQRAVFIAGGAGLGVWGPGGGVLKPIAFCHLVSSVAKTQWEDPELGESEELDLWNDGGPPKTPSRSGRPPPHITQVLHTGGDALGFRYRRGGWKTMITAAPPPPPPPPPPPVVSRVHGRSQFFSDLAGFFVFAAAGRAEREVFG